MDLKGTVFLHGYGVRGDTWERLTAQTRSFIGPFITPDLAAADVDDLIALAKGRVKRFSLEQHGPVLVVGHSLGAVLSAIVAHDLGEHEVAGAVMIAPPYGNRESVPGPFLRFLLGHRLIPSGLIRPRFFSNKTPVQDQKRIFAQAVPEAPGIQALTFGTEWFHVPRLTHRLSMPSLVIASESDRIVPSDQSITLAAVLGSDVLVFPREDGIGHDDLFAAPEVVGEVASRIAGFVNSAG